MTKPADQNKASPAQPVDPNTVDPNTADPALQPIRGPEGATVLGPRNLPREPEDRDLIVSPKTDHGTILEIPRIRVVVGIHRGSPDVEMRAHFVFEVLSENQTKRTVQSV